MEGGGCWVRGGWGGVWLWDGFGGYSLRVVGMGMGEEEIGGEEGECRGGRERECVLFFKNFKIVFFINILFP